MMKLTAVLRILAFPLLLIFLYLRITHTGESYAVFILAAGILMIVAARIIDYVNRKNNGPTSAPPNPEN